MEKQSQILIDSQNSQNLYAFYILQHTQPTFRGAPRNIFSLFIHAFIIIVIF